MKVIPHPFAVFQIFLPLPPELPVEPFVGHRHEQDYKNYNDDSEPYPKNRDTPLVYQALHRSIQVLTVEELGVVELVVVNVRVNSPRVGQFTPVVNVPLLVGEESTGRQLDNPYIVLPRQFGESVVVKVPPQKSDLAHGEPVPPNGIPRPVGFRVAVAVLALARTDRPMVLAVFLKDSGKRHIVPDALVGHEADGTHRPVGKRVPRVRLERIVELGAVGNLDGLVILHVGVVLATTDRPCNTHSRDKGQEHEYHRHEHLALRHLRTGTIVRIRV
ncbi:MAG: hypothetical protein IK038_02085 [Bacteroidaceae bacterium]|nr:hypothetical protein [Bacteroidaceae bacterium]